MSSVRRNLRTAAALVLGGSLLVVGGLTSEAADSQMTATEGVNIRSRPTTSSAIVGGLHRGQTVTTYGATDGWTKIRFSGGTAYIASRYLTAGGNLPAPLAVGAGSARVTTANVNLRRSPSLSAAVITVVPSGTGVTLSGKTSRGFSEVTVDGRRGWLSNQYLATARSGLPTVIGTRIATADLNVRTSSGSDDQTVGEIAKGSRVSVTGTTQNGRAQIVYGGAVRWVTARYLSNAPSSLPASPIASPIANPQAERGLTANAIAVRRAALAAFPEITTVYAIRRGENSDHGTGKALDLMITDYKSASSRAVGFRLAAWARTNAKSLNIHYVIWDQRIWNIQRSGEGWRYMASRGSDGSNHKNHVHISVW